MKRLLALGMLASNILTEQPLSRAATISQFPVEDTFISELSPDNNAGGHTNFAAGTVNTGTRTRALVRFDPAAHVPAGAVITEVSVNFQITRMSANGGAPSTFELRRVLVPWREGTKKSNLGSLASSLETTWSHRSYPDTPWTVPGGGPGADFAASASATAPIISVEPVNFGTTPGLVADVQFWLDNPSQNFGWVLMTQSEGTPATARRFGSREDPTNTPTLSIKYQMPGNELRLTVIGVNGNQVHLQWSGGAPPFQVQVRPNLTPPWTNLGPIIQTNVADLVTEAAQACFRIQSQ
jgi:hypothetical protein